MPITFCCRSKPQYCDAYKIFEQACRVFIGYPLVRREGEEEVEYNPQELQQCLVNPTCPDDEWNEQIAGRENRNFTLNRNFIPQVNEGSIVVIPRPDQGAAYLARITGPFEIVNCPPWGDAYLALRAEQGLDADDDAGRHIADVAQGWPVDEYRRVDLSRLPGWLRRSFLGQSTYNKLSDHPIDPDVTAYSVHEGILQGGEADPPPRWTLKLEEIKRRLVDTLNNPCAFENLVVELLQLENPHETWVHTGGPGDGGIDGIGSNEAGEIVGLMQAKYYAKQAPDVGDPAGDRPLRRYAAVLTPETPAEPTDGSCLLHLDWIASAVHQHWRCLPLARSMRVGEG